MDIKDIAKNAPEGATHYKVFASEIEYYKLVNGRAYYYRGQRCWRYSHLIKNFQASTPLPTRTKVEYVRVEDSIFHPELQSDFESELLFYSHDNESFFAFTYDERDLMRCLLNRSLYRRIETPITKSRI